MNIFDRDAIKLKFKDTRYKFGWEHFIDKDHFDDICYGIGWNTEELVYIIVNPEKIEYKFSFAYNATYDQEKVIPFVEDFYIPKTIDEFKEFIKRGN